MSSRRIVPAAVFFVLFGCAYTAPAAEYAPFNVRVGGQTFQPRYGFTFDTRLVETAKRLDEMGSDIIKFELSINTRTNYHLPSTPALTNLTMLASNEPSVRAVMDMPFRHIIVWAYPLTVPNEVNHPWRDGLSVTESNLEYNEMYNFSRYLLRQYNSSGKTFLLGHWEGDWALLGSFSPTATPTSVGMQGMADWLGTRQRAVADARAAEPHTNVFVWNYAEVNLVKKAMTGGVTVINNVLTNCTVDLVSYSSYDVLDGPPGSLSNALAYIAGKARTTSNFYRNVFVGEYGFPLDFGVRTAQEQSDLSAAVIREAAGWGAPFVLYWQTYDNEADEGGANARGFWLVDSTGIQQRVYLEHQLFLGRAHRFKNLYRFWLHRNPDEDALSSFARDYDSVLPSQLVSNILTSAEHSNTVSDSEFASFLVRTLLRGNPARDPDGAQIISLLASGASRFGVLCSTLDGARFKAMCPDGNFVDMLYCGTLGRVSIDHEWTEYSNAVAVLESGTPRSVLWSWYLDSWEAAVEELPFRHVDTVDARPIFTLHFFDYDVDADGLDDAWERQIVDFRTDDGAAGVHDIVPWGDYDGDGLANGAEYLAGTSPNVEDTDGDGLTDRAEAVAGSVVDGCLTETNLNAVVNATLFNNHDGTITLVRTNASVGWTDSVVDWQPGGSLLSLTGANFVTLLPVGFVSGGWWSVAVQLFTSNGVFVGEPPWFDESSAVTRWFTNVADLAATGIFTNATQFRMRFRCGPTDNGGSWPGVTLTYLSAMPAGATDPTDADTDDDGMTDREEGLAGTKATDADSWFRFVGTFAPADGGVVLSWPGVSNRHYTLERGGGVTNPSLVLSTNIPGTQPLNAYTDAPPGAASIYRLQVHP